MKGYKATYNMKCQGLTYEVGKIYSIDKLKMCSIGFHFCKDMKDVLDYYSYNENFILLEVEALGKTITEDNKTVTDSLKVLRVVPKEEYTFKIPVYEYDERNNMISKTTLSGNKWIWEYDERNNKISRTNSDGFKWTYGYDDNNNMIFRTTSNGFKLTWEYDEKNNKISQTDSDGSTWTYG